MSYSYARRTTKTEVTSGGSSQVIDISKKKTTLLKDGSWIRRSSDEDKVADQNPNFGRTVLNRVKSQDNLGSHADKDGSGTLSQSTSVQALSKRFSSSQDQLSKSSPLSPDRTSKTRSMSSSISPVVSSTDYSKAEPLPYAKSTSTRSSITTYSSSEDLGPTKTVSYSSRTEPSITTKITKDITPIETTVSKTSSITRDYSKAEPLPYAKSTSTRSSLTTYSSSEDLGPTKTVSYSSRTEPSITTKITKDITPIETTVSKTSSITRSSLTTYSSSEDLGPTKTVSYSSRSEPSYEYSARSKSYSSFSNRSQDNSYEFSSRESPSVYSKASYTQSSWTLAEKDICNYCHKPLNFEPKMILDDMEIHCHVSCFKCGVCHASLGHLKAGESLWVYQRSVHCQGCFSSTREKWHR